MKSDLPDYTSMGPAEQMLTLWQRARVHLEAQAAAISAELSAESTPPPPPAEPGNVPRAKAVRPRRGGRS
jgi:hypothetical protein